VIISFNHESLNRHDISQQDVLEALLDPFKIEVGEGKSKAGNPTSLWIGKTCTETILEV
jgi:hypothetical protein